MIPKIAMRTGALARILLPIGILFIVSVAFADTQQSGRECGNMAYKHYKSKGYAKMGCGSSTHYNIKQDTCFIYVTCETNHGKKVADYVEDLTRGKTHAKYTNSRPSTESGTCVVDGKQCTDYYHFQDLIRPYMEE